MIVVLVDLQGKTLYYFLCIKEYLLLIAVETRGRRYGGKPTMGMVRVPNLSVELSNLHEQ